MFEKFPLRSPRNQENLIIALGGFVFVCLLIFVVKHAVRDETIAETQHFVPAMQQSVKPSQSLRKIVGHATRPI